MRLSLLQLSLWIFTFFSFIPLNATIQEGDILIYKGDSVFIVGYPLGSYPEFKTIQEAIWDELGTKNGCTANWKGYQAVWEIIEDKLYLTAVQGPCGNTVQVNLQKVFGKDFKDDKVFAYWYDGDLPVQMGKIFLSNANQFRVFSEREEVLQVKGGIITQSEMFENFDFKSVYERNQKLLIEYVYSNINWNALPLEKGDSIRIVASFYSSNCDQKVDTVQIVKGGAEIYQNEVIRVLKSLPEWSGLWYRGECIPIKYFFPVVFCDTNREKYKTCFESEN